jgi:putative ABC transport system ATP-binding protein
MENVIIQTSKLCKTFSTEGIQQHVLKNLDLNIYNGDFTVIMGPSGSGKSTLLYALSGMDKPSLGSIHFDSKDITQLSEDKRAVFRKDNCGFVFQQIYLLDNMSVLDNIMTCGLLVKKDKKQIANKAIELLNLVNIANSHTGKFPSQLSGGEAQRVGIVRALINDPKVLFADEPTGALNSASTKAVLDVFTRIHEAGQSIVMVTHDLESARRGNRVLYLKDGNVCGECNLGKYMSNDEERHEKLNHFLKEMGW